MTDIDGILKHIDPEVSAVLDRAVSSRRIDARQCVRLFEAGDAELHVIGAVADLLRRQRAGDTVTFVINRNINFTNVCIKQCGFCAFSRDFREEEGYMLPVDEIVRRAVEARDAGATEVCIQAGLPPEMEPDTYERICRAIKSKMPDIHIHGFSPEEVKYGAACSGITVREYLSRLKEAGVGTLPGTSAEILDQGVRDRISPGRITVKEWEEVILEAHRMGIRTTSTMMYGHAEKYADRARHLERIRAIQSETGGFTEFVPLGFVHMEAPMYRNGAVGPGPGARDVLLTHAVSRIMLDNIDNLQVSWVKEGPALSQVLLLWGANDFGGTLINESISTSAGAGHGQLMRPGHIRHLILQAGRRPAQRDTNYNIIRTLDGETKDKLGNAARFGSYFELIKIDRFRYKRPLAHK